MKKHACINVTVQAESETRTGSGNVRCDTYLINKKHNVYIHCERRTVVLNVLEISPYMVSSAYHACRAGVDDHID